MVAAWVALAAAVVLLFAADTFKASQPMTPTFEVQFGMWLMAPTLEAEAVAGAAVGSIT